MNEKYNIFKEVKDRTDFLTTQLSEGVYKSSDVYANNFVHLIHTYREFTPFMKDAEFTDWIQKNHSTILAEVAMTGRMIMVIQNFFLISEK